MCYCPTPTLHLNLALTGDGAFLLSPKKTHSVWFISVLNYGDTENVLINHLLVVIPMSYPCHYTNLCPHKPHKHAHTHIHKERERERERDAHTQITTTCQSPYFFTLTWVNKCSQYFYFYQSIVTHEHLYFYLSKGCVYVCHLCTFLTSNLCFQPTYKSIIHNNPVKRVQKSAQIEQRLQAITVQNSAKQICGWILMWETTGDALLWIMDSYFS